MRAMTVTQYGDPEVLKLQDLPIPTPGDNDVLIKVSACGMNPVSYKMRQAERWGEREFPFVLGFDACGTIQDMGKNVIGFESGHEVYGSPSLMRDGADAEYVCADYRSVAIKPKSLDHAHAAAVPLAGLTAWEALHDHGRIATGQTVLIHAGAGGVGHLAIQIAKAAGCRVITTAGRDETIAFCNELGADFVINYKKHNVIEQIKELTNGGKCDVVFDTVGGDVFTDSIACVGFYGRLVTIVPGVDTSGLNSLFAKSASVHFEYMGLPTMFDVNPQRQGEILTQIGTLIDQGKITPHVSKRYPLEQLADAHRQQETGRTVGKLVIDVNPQ